MPYFKAFPLLILLSFITFCSPVQASSAWTEEEFARLGAHQAGKRQADVLAAGEWEVNPISKKQMAEGRK